MTRFALIVVASLLAWASMLHAQTATFTLIKIPTNATDGTYQLRLDVSDGDNFGVTSYGVRVNGNITFDHVGVGISSANGGAGNDKPAGFTLFRTADQATPVAGLLITGSQDTVNPTPYIFYCIGQTAGNALSSPTNGPITIAAAGDNSQNEDYRDSFLIATGSYSGGEPSFDEQNVDNGVNVFTSDQTLANQAATVEFETITCEPIVAQVDLAACISFVGEAGIMYEVVRIDADCEETIIQTVVGTGQTTNVVDKQNIPMSDCAKYIVRLATQ